jgi:glycosyltransferase involved in cell wall biosynthesis/predicted RNA-binding Zn-ribbon protein involved in translation (DUF1610 family)
MSRYPRPARNAALKCIPCGAPLVETTDERFVCVECGKTPIKKNRGWRRTVSRDGLRVEKTVDEADGSGLRIEYRFESTVANPVFFRVTDALPADVSPRGVDVDVEFGSDDVDESEPVVAFDRYLDAGDAVTAAVRVEDGVDEAPLRVQPTVEVVAPLDAGFAKDRHGAEYQRTALRDGDPGAAGSGAYAPSPSSWSGSVATNGSGHGVPSPAPEPAPKRTNGTGAVAGNGTSQPTHERRARPAAGDDAIVERRSSSVLVALPAYNEAKTVADVVEEAEAYADEVLVVDDGSDDDTADRAAAAGATVVEHETNGGYGAALKTIFREAYRRDVDHLVIIDSDGQHDPSDIPQLIDRQWSSGAELVIGSRFVDGAETDMPVYRRFGLEVINGLINLSLGVVRPSSTVSDTQCGFRAYDRRAIRTLAHDDRIGEGMDASIDILFHAHQHDYRIEEVPTTVSYDVEDANNHNPLYHGYQLVKNVLRTLEYERPILCLGLPGFVLAFAGLTTAYLSFDQYLQTGALSTELAFAAGLLTLLGTFTAFTAIILHSLNAVQTATTEPPTLDYSYRR